MCWHFYQDIRPKIVVKILILLRTSPVVYNLTLAFDALKPHNCANSLVYGLVGSNAWGAITIYRTVVPEPGGPGGPLTPPIFGSSVNPILTGGGHIMPTNYHWPPQSFSPSVITE